MQITLPHDNEIERFCLSAMLRDSESMDEASNSLQDVDFFDPDHAKIFMYCLEIHKDKKPVNHLFVSKKIQKPEGNCTWDYLIRLSNEYFSGMDYAYYFQQLKNFSALRRLIFMLNATIQDAARKDTHYEQLIGNFYTNLLKVDSKTVGSIHPSDLLKSFRRNMSFVEYMDWKRERFAQGLPTFEGVPSYYPRLDSALGAFQCGSIYYIGARTSMGKTTFLLNLVANIMKKHKVAIFSLEMDAQLILEKLICIYSDVKYAKFSSGEFTQDQYEKIKSCIPFFSQSELWFDDEQGLTITKLVSRANRLVKVHGVEIIFIDYLTLIKASGKHPNKHLQIDEISKGIQSLAKQLKIPIIVLAQLNRDAGDGNRPTLTSFRESGSIEEDADACLLIHRPEYYSHGTRPGEIDIIIAKNRIMGKLCTIQYNCNSQVSEKYHEMDTIENEIKKSRDKEIEDRYNAQFPTSH